MTIRTAAAALFALTAVAVAAPAQAAPDCTVTVMGMTFSQCRPDAVVASRVEAPSTWTRGTAPAEADLVTGSVVRAPVRR